MICASCDREIPEAALICSACNGLEPPGALKSRTEPSYRDLSGTLRHLKGLVLLSILFGIFVAPFAIYLASKALHRYGPQATEDPLLHRKLVVLRRLATALLVVWAALLGSGMAGLMRA